MEIRCVEEGAEGYGECLELRRVILREPLGLGWSAEDLVMEEREWQMGIWDEDLLVGCVSVRWPRPGVARLRQMAVRGDRQGSFLGRSASRRW